MRRFDVATLAVVALLVGACGAPTNEASGPTTTDQIATTTSTARDTTSTPAAPTTTTVGTTTTTTTTGDSASSHQTLRTAPASEFPPFVQDHAEDIKSLAGQVGLAPVAPLHPLEGFDWSIEDSSLGTLPGAYRYNLIAADQDSPTEYTIELRVAPNSAGFEEELKADGWIEAEEVSLSEGFTAYWFGMGEKIEFMVVPADMDFTVTLGVYRSTCEHVREENFEPGICLDWSDIEDMLHGLGVIE